jgi:DNA polymerase III alpha subunit (gram-positive type)
MTSTSAYLLPSDIVIFDLETDGSDDNLIVEVGAVRVSEDFKILDTFQSFVGGRPLTQAARDHMKDSITDAMLIGAPVIKDALQIFAEWCGPKSGYMLSAWGAYFDVCVLRSEWARLGEKYPHPGRAFDVKAVAWWESVFTPRTTSSMAGLGSICKRLGLEFQGTPHRALDDAMMEARVLLEMYRQRMVQFT